MKVTGGLQTLTLLAVIDLTVLSQTVPDLFVLKVTVRTVSS